MTFRSEFIKNILKGETSKPSKMVFESFESHSFSENDKITYDIFKSIKDFFEER